MQGNAKARTNPCYMIEVSYRTADVKMAEKGFLEFLREGIAERIRESHFDKHLKDVLKRDLEILNKRYRTDLKVSGYKDALCRSLMVYARGNILTVKLYEKSKYYRVLKSVELGSYMVRRIPILGDILAMMKSIIERLYTDYEVLVAKLDYYRKMDSMRYRLLSRYSPYQAYRRLSNRLRLL